MKPLTKLLTAIKKSKFHSKEEKLEFINNLKKQKRALVSNTMAELVEIELVGFDIKRKESI